MKYFLFHLFIIFLFPLFCFSQLYQKNKLVELTFYSSKSYINPIKDCKIKCTLYHGKDTISVYGFWFGDNTYKVRFSLNKTGIWHYITECSDITNSLHNQSGSIDIDEYNGLNPLYKKGNIKVSNNKRYLVYDNNDPFFYLGDTAWEITWKSYKEQVYNYISDRKQKGFTAIQIVALSHQFLNKYGVENRYKEKSFIDNDFFKINPRYFDYLDFIVQTVNDSGLVAVIVPLWAGMSEVNFNKQYLDNFLTIEQSLNLAKYIGARYSGYKVIWIIGGDNSYNTNEQKIFWSNFATEIKKSTGYQQLCTCHPMGYSASFDYFNSGSDWLDFHMYQSSHVAGGDYTWIAAINGYNLNQIKPILNGEPNYEDIYNNLWAPGDTNHINSFRIKPVHVRQASYESILSGALVGITYGANGIWQWNTEELPGSHLPRYNALNAINLPGSKNMTILKNIMVKFDWYSFKPNYKLIKNFSSPENFIPIAENDKVCIIYFPVNTKQISLIEKNQLYAYYAYWINPSNGDSTAFGYFNNNTSLTPPDTNDWILVFEKNKFDISSYNWKSFTDNIKISNNYPNPFNSKNNLKIAIHQPIYVSIKIYDILGREVYDFGEKLFDCGIHSVEWEPKNYSSGIYFYVIKSENYSMINKVVYIR